MCRNKCEQLLDAVSVILSKRGQEWTDDDLRKALEAVCHPECVIYWIAIAKRILFARYIAHTFAEEVVYDFVADNFRNLIGTFDPITQDLKPYLTRSLINYCNRWNPTGRKRYEDSLNVLENSDSAESRGPDPADIVLKTMINKEEKERLYRCLNTLDHQDRRAIEFHYFDDLPYKLIGERLGITEVNARMRVLRARRLLRRCMGDDEAQPEGGNQP